MGWTRQQIIDRARQFLATPYHHQGRVPGAGLDCVGPIVVIGREMGIGYERTPQYSRWADGVSLLGELGAHLERIERPSDALPGDVLVFWIARPGLPQHVAIRTDVGILHSHSRIGRVVEHGLSDNWVKRICAAYKFPGVI